MKKHEKRNLKKTKDDSTLSFKSFQVYIESLFSKILKEVIYIDFIHISFAYKENNEGNLVFSINYDKPYHDAYICIYPLAFDLYKQGRKKELFRGAIHELCHLYTCPVDRIASDRFVTQKNVADMIENLTEIIKNYIMINKELMAKIKVDGQ